MLKTLHTVKPPSYPQCTYIWQLMYTGHDVAKKNGNMEYENTKRGSYSFDIWKATAPILLLFIPPCFAFHLASLFNFQQFSMLSVTLKAEL